MWCVGGMGSIYVMQQRLMCVVCSVNLSIWRGASKGLAGFVMRMCLTLGCFKI